jgi:hypothetical protein
MTVKSILVTLLALAITLTACSPAATPAPASRQDTYVSASLDAAHEGALSARNQLTLGTLELDGTANAVTSEQATTLLPLWQALRGTTRSGASAQAEVNALLAQIESAMTPDQLAAIRAMQLTQTDLQEWAAVNGISIGAGRQGGGGQELPPEVRATRQAEQGRAPGNANGGASTAMLDAVIAYLDSRTR